MFTKCQVKSGYAQALPDVGDKAFEFKPGLNILFGPNGCGKSSLLNILGAYSGINYDTGGWTSYQEPIRLSPRIGDYSYSLPDYYHLLSPGKCKADVIWD